MRTKKQGKQSRDKFGNLIFYGETSTNKEYKAILHAYQSGWNSLSWLVRLKSSRREKTEYINVLADNEIEAAHQAFSWFKQYLKDEAEIKRLTRLLPKEEDAAERFATADC